MTNRPAQKMHVLHGGQHVIGAVIGVLCCISREASRIRLASKHGLGKRALARGDEERPEWTGRLWVC